MLNCNALYRCLLVFGFVAGVPCALHLSGEPLHAQQATRSSESSEPDALARLRRSVDSSLDARVAVGVPGLVVGVFRDSAELFVKSAGESVRSSGRSYRATQPQPIGSITKQFTAVAVLGLIDSGQVALDDPISRWFPSFPARLRSITVRQLLNQTSGLGRYEARFMLGAPVSMDTVLQVIAAAAPTFAPGEKFGYNNANYVVLGAIIERVSGVSWDRFLASRFLQPLGMRQTGACEITPADSLIGYMRAGAQPAPRPPMPVMMTSSAGALCSTVHDLARWAHALHSGQLLSAESYTWLHTPPALPDGTPNSYAMGLVSSRVGSHARWWHNGALTSGFHAQLAYYPEDRLTIIVLANAYPAELEAVDEAAYRAWRAVESPARP